MTLRKVLGGLADLLAASILFSLGFALAASAQTADGSASSPGFDLSLIGTVVGLIAVALVGLYGVAVKIVDRMAAAPTVDGWDEAKATLEKLKPIADTLTKWADPDDPAVPPTPTNRTGTSG
jgi:hypothetical protein